MEPIYSTTIYDRHDLETVIEGLDILGFKYTVENKAVISNTFVEPSRRGMIGWKLIIYKEGETE